MAIRTARLNELDRCCLAATTLAMASTAKSRTPVPIMAAEAPVTIAIAEPETAAYICQRPAPRLIASRSDGDRNAAK
jgi:hypothetical protein